MKITRVNIAKVAIIVHFLMVNYISLITAYLGMDRGNNFWKIAIIYFVKLIILASLTILVIKKIKINTRVFVYFFLLFGLSLFSLVFNSFKTGNAIVEIILFHFTDVLMLFLPALLAKNYEEYLSYFSEMSYWAIPFIILYPFSPQYLNSGEYMHYGYACMLYICALIVKRNKKLIDILLIVSECILMFIYGNRGALLCVGIVIVLYLYVTKRLQIREMVIFSSGILVALLIYHKINKYALALYEFLRKYDIQSRTLLRIVSGTFKSSVGRTVLYGDCIDAIKNNVLGYGIGYDRVIGLIHGHGYAHNIFLECWIDFGLIFGSVIALFIVVYGLSILIRRCYSDDVKLLTILLWGSSFVQLLLSSSLFLCAPMITFLLLKIDKQELQEISNI